MAEPTECGKAAYRSKRMAQTVANKVLRSRRGRLKPKKLRAYHCGRCKRWHRTSEEKR
jgi:hypothetical protein